MAEQTHPKSVYFIVFAALLALLALTIGLAFLDLGRHVNNALAMLIAVIKGVLIVLFFMHVRYSKWLTWFFAGAGFLWLGILIVLTMSDYVTRNRPEGTNFKGEPVFLTRPHRLPDRPTLIPPDAAADGATAQPDAGPRTTVQP